MERIFFTDLATPIGTLLLAGTADALRAIRLTGERGRIAPLPEWTHDPRPLRDATRQIEEYFARRRRSFELRVEPRGTDFQMSVWNALREIPYGATISYGELARRIGRPGAFRAVGLANGANPIPIVIPCHRVIGADGSLTGYGGGLERKRLLLDLEAGVLPLTAGTAAAPPGAAEPLPAS